MLKKFLRHVSLGQASTDDAGHVQDAALTLLARLDRPAIVTDIAGVVQYMNEPAETLTARSIAEAVGRPLGEIVKLAGNTVSGSIVGHLT
jgi:nitrogen-specific signal transduction histidine kinase